VCGVLPVDIVVAQAAADLPPNARVLHIVDTLDDPDALAYHTTDGAGRPVLRLGVVVCRAEAAATSTPLLDVISDAMMHEVFETARNPFVNRFLAGPWAGKKVADEACDPLQGSGYRVGKTWIPNFTLPAWGDAADAEGPYDFVSTLGGPHVLVVPFGCLTTGYLAFDDGTQAQGAEMTPRARARAGGRLAARRGRP
jgi:hypothetical protein